MSRRQARPTTHGYRARSLRLAGPWCLVLIGLGVAGCAADRWSAFDVDWQDKLEQEAKRSSDLPRRFDPDPVVAPIQPTTDDAGRLVLSIEQATLLALRHNRDLAVERQSPVIVGAFELIERGRFDPEVFGSLSYQEETTSEIDRATGQQFSVDGKDTAAEAGVRQELPTGTSVEAAVTQERSISNRAPEQQEARLGLTVTQSLLRGFGPAANLVRVRQAELDTAASVYELRGFTEVLLADTEIAYWRFVLAMRRIDIFERSLEIARKQRDQIDQRIEVGALARTEVAAAISEIALREQGRINAYADFEASRLQLVRLMNPADDGSLDQPILPTTIPAGDAAAIDDTSDRLALAQRLRPDLNEARIRLDQGRLETILTRNGLLPRLDLFITLGKSGFANTFSDSFKNLDEDAYDAGVGVSLSQAIGNRAARGRDLAARASREQAVAAVSNLEQMVTLDVRLAINEAERLRQQIAATAATRAAQEQTVEAEQERFNVGASTALQVAQAQRDLLIAEIAEVEALVNYRIALVQLHLAEGSLLERRGVVIRDVRGGP